MRCRGRPGGRRGASCSRCSGKPFAGAAIPVYRPRHAQGDRDEPRRVAGDGVRKRAIARRRSGPCVCSGHWTGFRGLQRRGQPRRRDRVRARIRDGEPRARGSDHPGGRLSRRVGLETVHRHERHAAGGTRPAVPRRQPATLHCRVARLWRAVDPSPADPHRRPARRVPAARAGLPGGRQRRSECSPRRTHRAPERAQFRARLRLPVQQPGLLASGRNREAAERPVVRCVCRREHFQAARHARHARPRGSDEW